MGRPPIFNCAIVRLASYTRGNLWTMKIHTSCMTSSCEKSMAESWVKQIRAFLLY